MHRLILALLLFCAAPVLADEQDTLKRIAAQLEQHAVVRAEFTQTKQMAALKRPLVSSGRLVFSRRHGVLWQIEQPYRMTYVLGAERIVEIAADGTHRQRGLREVPGLAQVGRVFRALLGADTATLQENFAVTVTGDPADDGRWQIDLVPRSAQLAQFLRGLQLSGHAYAENIVIEETGGGRGTDRTQIRLVDSHAAAAPSPDELRLFELSGEPARP
ncbi:MAG: outer membrane lipoprotein carrier protein LolA [Propionivibrio sp.]